MVQHADIDHTGITGVGGGIAATLFDAKGDLIAASAADTAVRLAAAANGAALVTASGESTGLKWRLNNDGAAVAPAVTDDSGDGYSIGSRWLDTTADKEYVALDVSVGAAVWVETTAAGGGGAPTSSESVLTTDVTMTNADQFYDSGLSLSLAAGTWFLWGKVGIRVANAGATAIIARLVNSDASVIYDGTSQNVPANGGQEWFLPIGARITLGSTTTVKVQCEDSARAASIILGDSNTDDAPDNQLSRLIAVAVS